MFLSKHYTIDDTHKFTFSDYPEIMDELHTIKKRLAHKPPYHKCDMVISYFRDHCLKNGWIEINPDVATLLTTGDLKSGHIESLFASCKKHRMFLAGYESCIRQTLLDIN